MARTYGFCSAHKTIAATTAQTIVFPPSEIDSSGIVAFHVNLSATGNTVADVSRVRVKANGTTIIDVSQAFLLAFQDRFFGRLDATTLQAFTIPLYIGDAPTDDAADACQFMPGASATVEVDLTTGSAAGVALLSWTKTTVPAAYYPTLISQPMNCAASSINARVALGAPGIVQGIGFLQAHLAQARVVLSGIEVMNLPGPVYGGLVLTQGATGIVQNLFDSQATTANVMLKLNQGLPANPANSWMEISGDASMVAADDYCLYSLVPVAQG